MYHYVEYVSKVKENLNAGLSKDSAIDEALSFAIKNDFFDGSFKVMKSEVLGMSLTEFD